MKRIAALGFVFALPLAGCKEPASASGPVPSLIRSGGDVAIKRVRLTPALDAQALTNDEYYVITFTFTNDLGYALVPRIGHFVLEDNQRRRFLGADSGSPTLVGIDNPAVLLKQGESHEYTVGFRVPQNTTGMLYYDATF